jgi:hypothetical protein
MTATTMTNPQLQAIQLAEQINDEFLTCKICFEHYKDPKCLSCLHTFCEECIEQHINAQRSYKYTDYREFSCPICRKKTVIPTGGVRKLNDNFLISSLNELLISKKPSKIPFCDICKIVNQREREATSKCVECQKSMCRTCVVQHQQMKITSNHSIYELDIEKDIMCKQHPNEQVRFYCEQCEVCVCVPCTFTDHRDHDLVDFKQGITHHKDAIEENLSRCRLKISEIRNRLDLLRKCETHILYAQNEIHSTAMAFIDSIREKEQALLNDLNESYGEETNEYIKKRDELETFLDQLKSTCNLTEMVVKGKDIELLLLKKQLCEKFDEFQQLELESLPRNILKKVCFIPGSVDLGKITEVGSALLEKKTIFNTDSIEDEDKNSNKNNNTTIIEENEEFDDVEESTLEMLNNNDNNKINNGVTSKDESTQIFYRDYRDICGDKIKETEVQTDIRMIHELVNHRSIFERPKDLPKSPYELKTDSKLTQTDSEMLTSSNSNSNISLSSNSTSSLNKENATLSAQSSIEDDSNAPVDRNKLGRRVRRHVKPGCSIAVLPNSEIIIIDPESNCVTILDRRGKYRFGMSNSNKQQSLNEQGQQQPPTPPYPNPFSHLAKLEKGARIMTPQGTLIIKLEHDHNKDNNLNQNNNEQQQSQSQQENN